jgi:RES domain-containing protein
VQVWRLVHKRRVKEAYSGEGARLAGGRWNSPGHRVVYVSATQALAQLEYLVHANATRAPRAVVAVPAQIPDDLKVDSLDLRALPKHWRRYYPIVQELKTIGDAWLAGKSAAVLRVPSAVVPSEANYLLNPAHLDFARIRCGRALPVEFDTRLLSAARYERKRR